MNVLKTHMNFIIEKFKRTSNVCGYNPSMIKEEDLDIILNNLIVKFSNLYEANKHFLVATEFAEPNFLNRLLLEERTTLLKIYRLDANLKFLTKKTKELSESSLDSSTQYYLNKIVEENSIKLPEFNSNKTPFNILANRYLNKISSCEEKLFTDGSYTNKSHLIKMLTFSLENENIWPVEKLYNWLGYVSGVLAENAIINIEEERNFSRPIYHAYYKRKGLNVPETLDLLKR